MNYIINRCVFVLFFFTILTFGQESKGLEDALRFDYFNYNYKFLDKNYKIKISKNVYNQTINKYKYFPEKIKTYGDSLSVVLMAEFNDWDKARVGQNRIAFSFLRLSYYFWITEKEAEQLVKKYKFKMPYQLYEFVNEEKYKDGYLKNVIFHLRNKVYKKTSNEKVNTMSVPQLLSYALKESPRRIEDFQEKQIEREHGKKPTKYTKLGEGCGKKDCCQTRKVK